MNSRQTQSSRARYLKAHEKWSALHASQAAIYLHVEEQQATSKVCRQGSCGPISNAGLLGRAIKPRFSGLCAGTARAFIPRAPVNHEPRAQTKQAPLKRPTTHPKGEPEHKRPATKKYVVPQRDEENPRRLGDQTIEAIGAVLAQVVGENDRYLRQKPPNLRVYGCDRDSKEMFDEPGSPAPPKAYDLYKFLYNMAYRMRFQREGSVAMLAYVDRLIEDTGLVLNKRNWRKVCFTAMMLSQKVWDDYSYDNNDYRKLFPGLTTEEVNDLERIFLRMVGYKMGINSELYQKYRTHLQALYSDKLELRSPPMTSPAAPLRSMDEVPFPGLAALQDALSPRPSPLRKSVVLTEEGDMEERNACSPRLSRLRRSWPANSEEVEAMEPFESDEDSADMDCTSSSLAAQCRSQPPQPSQV